MVSTVDCGSIDTGSTPVSHLKRVSCKLYQEDSMDGLRVKTIASKAINTGSNPALRTFLKRALNIGSWCNGSTLISKIKSQGPIPWVPAMAE